MRTNYKDIVHEYDVWHLAKSLAKKIKLGTCMVHIRTYTLLCMLASASLRPDARRGGLTDLPPS
jgi:hypothetical protein